MSALFDMSGASALGAGLYSPPGCILDPELAKTVAGYKRTIASRYRALTPDEFDQLPDGPMWASPKIDGEAWFLVVDGEQIALLAPNGKVITGDIPVLQEARKLVQPRARGRLLLAGELFALRKGGRPRVGDLANARSGGADAETSRIGFHAYDLLTGGDAENEGPMPDYGDRLAAMQRLCEGGKRLQCIRTESLPDATRVPELFAEWAEGGKGEGIVVRSAAIGRTFKIKPSFSLDLAVVGFTERADEDGAVRSLLLAVMKESGQFQIVGSCGNMKSLEFRKELHATLSADIIPSAYTHASSSGAIFRFVNPKMVVEVKVTDIQAEDSSGSHVRRMVLEYHDGDDARFTAVAPMIGVSILHPVLVRVRDDKEVNPVDVRAAQVLERVFVHDVADPAERVELPKSEVIRREVYAKETKGKTAVRKLLVWKTNKESESGEFAPFVVHFTDYSSGRKDPLKREVRLAPTEEQAMLLAEDMVASNIKKGWKRADE
ncbi:MAG: hypothetical protein AB8H86_30425 [Polyangiales bacterium]